MKTQSYYHRKYIYISKGNESCLIVYIDKLLKYLQNLNKTNFNKNMAFVVFICQHYIS